LNNLTQKLIVIKLGGSIINSKDSAVQDVIHLHNSGYRVVLVHGGAKMVTRWMADQGVTAQFYQGERITDARALSVVTAVLAGLANKETDGCVYRRRSEGGGYLRGGWQPYPGQSARRADRVSR
jgi:acetylglutamate kinase